MIARRKTLINCIRKKFDVKHNIHIENRAPFNLELDAPMYFNIFVTNKKMNAKNIEKKNIYNQIKLKILLQRGLCTLKDKNDSKKCIRVWRTI